MKKKNPDFNRETAGKRLMFMNKTFLISEINNRNSEIYKSFMLVYHTFSQAYGSHSCLIPFKQLFCCFYVYLYCISLLQTLFHLFRK